MYEQNEIEFLPCPLESAAEQLLIAKWMLRTLAYKYGVRVSFAPKITIGKAGSGLHIHTRLMKNGKNVMIEKGRLSDTAKKMIAGFLDLSPSLTSFGNINPTSYFRLVPNQEAPTNICWGDRNRSVLVRVPLGWTGNVNMVRMANPLEDAPENSFYEKQTVEYRGADGTADIYLLMASLAVAARHGLEMKDALKYSERTYVDVNIFQEGHNDRRKNLPQLPASCWESAEALQRQKPIYLKSGIFSGGMIDWITSYLKSFNDKNLRRDIGGNEEEIMKLVQQYFHCG
jgi:glutamine synthetase